MDKINSLGGLLLHEVQDLYSAEKQLVKALPKVAKKASSPELRNAVQEHLAQTQTHVSRLEQVFEMLGARARTRTCKAMKGILEEADETLGIKAPPETRDAAIILAAQKVEHYEIAGYGSLMQWADLTGRAEVKNLLNETLREEKQTDRKLTELAASGINRKAAESHEEHELAE